MPLGFYVIMAAQFFSALADNALLIVAIALLRDMAAPAGFPFSVAQTCTLHDTGVAEGGVR